jgi:tRNA nucleotidyltransferase (CCA-adding enzyme)
MLIDKFNKLFLIALIMGVKNILNSVLDEVSLSKEELFGISTLAEGVVKEIKRIGKVDVFIGGSLAKGTLVRPNSLHEKAKQDVDVFVVFDYSENISKLEGILKKVKLPGKLKRVHGSRDYFQIVCEKAVLEIIPVVKNADPRLAENVTDVSLRHVKYIRGKITKNKVLANEIKLAKVFCKANEFYGAESYIKGFSGYSLEVLIIHFGGFIKMLKGLIRLSGKGKIVIDPEKHFRNSQEVLSELNSSKLHGPIVLVDPTHHYRNVCAGLGFESFRNFLGISKKFLKSPSKDFFIRKEFDSSTFQKLASKKKARFIEMNLVTKRQEGDIAGTKMKKFFDFVITNLGNNGQKVLSHQFVYLGSGQKSKGYVVVSEVKMREIRGPPISNLVAVKSFKKARGSKVFKRRGFWWAKEKVSIDSLLKKLNSIGKEMGAWIV